MFKKIISIIILLLVMMSCNTQKTVIRTTKNTERKPTQTVVRSVKKPIENNIPKKTDEIVIENKQGETQILEATTRVKVTTEMVLAYIEKYKQIAMDDMVKFGIPASITLSQAILESGAGTGPLSVQANNHFGIKCHKDWTGDSIKHDDDSADECFRKYDNPNKSFEDHSVFLLNRPWYAKLFKLEKTDYKGWARGLKTAGYATDPKYPDKLIGLIEKYKLNLFDAQALGNLIINEAPLENVNTQNTQTTTEPTENSYIVIPKDTLYSISKKFNLTIDEIKKMNNITDNAISIGQILKIK
jgi:flagellum-specific peptidoglycan hydrolase FlgJ